MTGNASAETDAPLDEVWALVEDVAVAPEWQNGLEALTPIERDEHGRPTLVETESHAKVRRVKARVRFSYGAPTRLSWRQEKGELKSLDGSWTLEDLGGGRTRATYALEIDPGGLLGMLVRGPAEDIVRKLVVNSRPGDLKARVERG